MRYAAGVTDRVQLGLGLIGIGRPWGFVAPEVPSESVAAELLEGAFALGIRYFDTAASYGYSEERLGRFLRCLSASERDAVTVATKFGETWDFEKGEPVVGHSFDALRRSLDRSFALLGRIDLLQLHKTTPAVLASDDLPRAWDYAASAGIARFGASVSDPDSGALALAAPRYDMLQLPLHREAPQFLPVVVQALRAGKWVAANRPFGMGRHLYADPPVTRVEAFAFVLRRLDRGVVLTGTKSLTHLAENVEAFHQAASA